MDSVEHAQWLVRATQMLQNKAQMSPELYLDGLEHLLRSIVQPSTPPAQAVSMAPKRSDGLCYLLIDLQWQIVEYQLHALHCPHMSTKASQSTHIDQIWDPSTYPQLAQHLLNAFAGQTEHICIGCFDQMIHLQTLPLLDTQGRIHRVLCSLQASQAQPTTSQPSAVAANNELNLEQLIDNLQKLVFQIDLTGHLLFVGPNWERLLGVQPNQILGQPFNKFLHPSVREEGKQVVRDFLDGNARLANFETRILLPNHDTPHEVEVELRPTINSRGQRTGAFGIMADAMVRNQALRKWQQAATYNEHLLRLLPDLLLVQDFNSVYIDAHVPDASIAIAPPESFIGKKMQEVIPDWLAKLFEGYFAKAIQSKSVEQIEYSLELNQKLHYFEARLKELPGERIMTIVRDITQRKTAELRLKASEERWNFAFAATGDGVWDWSVNNGTLYLSDSWWALYGYPASEQAASYDSLLQLVHPLDREGLQQAMEKHLMGETPRFRYEQRMRHQQGHYLWVLNRGLVIERDAQGKPLRFVGTHTDISEGKQAEEDLRRLNVTKDKFFSIISHDLRSPFSTLIGFTELLTSGYHNLSERKRLEYINYIHQVSATTYNLLDNLLTWSRSQRGRMPFQPQAVSVEKLVADQLENFEFLVLKKNLMLRTQIEPGIRIWADVDMVQTIVRNLVSNAIKFSQPGKEIVLQASVFDQMAVIGVQDFGIGIDPGDQEKLFRIDESYSTYGTEQEKGTGLGLILCKEFVTRHGGEIGVESELGRGSTFWFTIPVVRP